MKENWLKEWEETGIIRGLPLSNGGTYKGFLLLMCYDERSTFWTQGIIGLDDNLEPKEFCGMCDRVDFETTIDEVKEEEVKIEKLSTKFSAYSYSSDKYRFRVLMYNCNVMEGSVVEVVK